MLKGFRGPACNKRRRHPFHRTSSVLHFHCMTKRCFGDPQTACGDRHCQESWDFLDCVYSEQITDAPSLTIPSTPQKFVAIQTFSF